MAKNKNAKKQEKFTYFYLNNTLHKVLRKKRSEDLLIAWDFPNGKRVAYILSDVQKNKQRAYSIPEVAKFLNRHPETIKRHMRKGEIKIPQFSYTFDDNRRLLKYFFSENDVKELHDFFKTVHRGRPRIDGDITPSNIPSPAELEAMMRNEKILYVKNEVGEFVPVWKQPEW
ncbi:MAG: DNA-binding protein [Alphaproteobacteria bacterium]|nr:DNA-binding protein [Alphaproteobacteria bacterium]